MYTNDFIYSFDAQAPSNDLLSTSDANLAANFDPAELDQFLASIWKDAYFNWRVCIIKNRWFPLKKEDVSKKKLALK
jgi:hypothetical protein